MSVSATGTLSFVYKIFLMKVLINKWNQTKMSETHIDIPDTPAVLSSGTIAEDDIIEQLFTRKQLTFIITIVYFSGTCSQGLESETLLRRRSWRNAFIGELIVDLLFGYLF